MADYRSMQARWYVGGTERMWFEYAIGHMIYGHKEYCKRGNQGSIYR